MSTYPRGRNRTHEFKPRQQLRRVAQKRLLFFYNHIITGICAYPISINSLLPTIPFTAVFLRSVSKTG